MKQTVEPAPHPANAFRNLNTQEVADLERAGALNPTDVESRKKLLIYYAPARLRPMQDAQALIATRRHHILWMIEHHPDDLQAFALGAVIYPSPRAYLPIPKATPQQRRYGSITSTNPIPLQPFSATPRRFSRWPTNLSWKRSI